MTVSCIIPAFNEESTIKSVIRTVKNARVCDEIIVVDDGSSDNTFRIAESENVAVIKHSTNRGKGAAIKTGLKAAKGSMLLFIDADIRNLDGRKIRQMASILKSKTADVVIGTYSFNCFQTFTEVIYRPLMGLFFPEVLSKITKGHLSGERGFAKKILKKLNLRDGFDLEAIMNIELACMSPSPRIAYVDLGDIRLRPKRYQKSMGAIAYSILDYAKKKKRIGRLEESSFVRCSRLLYTASKQAK